MYTLGMLRFRYFVSRCPNNEHRGCATIRGFQSVTLEGPRCRRHLSRSGVDDGADSRVGNDDGDGDNDAGDVQDFDSTCHYQNATIL